MQKEEKKEEKKEEFKPKVYVNGKFLDQDVASVSVFDMGLLFGASVYDVGYIYQGKPFDWVSHYKRIELCSSLINLTVPLKFDEMKKICEELATMNKVEYGLIYCQITYGAMIGVRNNSVIHKKPKDLKSTIFIFTIPMNTMDPIAAKKGIKCKSIPDRRWRKAHVKTTSLMANALAGSQASFDGFQEAILYDDKDKNTVLEGSATNMFCVKNGVIYTHPLEDNPEDMGRVLHGVTRMHTLELAKKLKIPLKEEKFTLEFFKNADEVFLSSTTKEVFPIVKVDDKEIGKGVAGEITLKLLKAYVEMVEKELGIKHPKAILFNI